MNTPQEVRHWSARYPVAYDTQHYDPNIVAARTGDQAALWRVTQWKNPGRGNPPKAMRLSGAKEVAFQRFIRGLNRYLAPGGSEALRADFVASSPVYSIFWHHVLFGSPIFDVHTNRAFQFFTTGVLLVGKKAAVPRGGHWELHDRYTIWFHQTLDHLRAQDPNITERMLDRALMQWGLAHKKSTFSRE
ncbi:hypothetical protein [Prosthecobacter sp.]|uniref:hypothetical protein n=1 Tax=Prosthecobacter sp. TaxID=1965333 RepID=UPI003784855D